LLFSGRRGDKYSKIYEPWRYISGFIRYDSKKTYRIALTLCFKSYSMS